MIAKKALFLILAAFLLQPSLAIAAAPACHKIYSESTPALFEKPRGSLVSIHKTKEFLTASDRQEIQGIFSDTKLSMTEKIYKAYRIYNSARLRIYSPSERAEVERILDAINFSFTFNGQKKLIANLDQVSVPFSFESSAILMGLMVHEREHRAQIYRYMGSYEKIEFSKEIFPLLLAQAYGFKTKFFMERDAMRAEWEALNILPPEAIQHSLEIVKNSTLEPHAKTVLTRMLENSRMSQDEYIRTEHKNGRYSHLANIKESSQFFLRTIAILVLIIYPVYSLM